MTRMLFEIFPKILIVFEKKTGLNKINEIRAIKKGIMKTKNTEKRKAEYMFLLNINARIRNTKNNGIHTFNSIDLFTILSTNQKF